MTDETLSPAPEYALPLTEDRPAEPKPDEVIDLDAPDPDEDRDFAAEGEGEEGEEIELDTIEFDGRQFQVPKALKPGFMMQADYTRKTQGLAEERRELDAVRHHVVQQSQAVQEEASAWGRLSTIDDALKAYEGVDFSQFNPNDPVGDIQLGAHYRRFQALREQRGEVVGYLYQRHQTRSQEAEQDFANRHEETQRYAETQIKGWSPEIDKKLEEYATNEGITKEQVRQYMSPTFLRLLHKAWIGDQAMKQASTKPPSRNGFPVQPLRQVAAKSGQGPRTSLYETDDMDDFVRRRRAGEMG